jgi:hypothetical protein
MNKSVDIAEQNKDNSDFLYILNQKKVPSIAIVGVQPGTQSIYNAYKDSLCRLVNLHFPSDEEAPDCVKHNKPDYIVLSEKYLEDVHDTFVRIMPVNGKSKYIFVSGQRIPAEDLNGVEVCCTIKDNNILSVVKSIDEVLKSYTPEKVVYH